MGLSRKKPCTICQRWYVPDPRIGKRQRACKLECQAARRKKVQAAWRAKNPDYFIGRRIQQRNAEGSPPAPLRMPAPLSRLPWDIAQAEFTVQGADFIGVLGTLLLRAVQSEFKAHVVDCIRVSGTHANSEAQAQIRLGP
jgi:ParB-like nuclease domain